MAPYQGVGIYTFITKELVENEKFKNANSITFLDFSLKKMKKMQYRILNTDLTIILQ